MTFDKAIPEVRFAISESGGRVPDEDETKEILIRMQTNRLVSMDDTHVRRTVKTPDKSQLELFLKMMRGGM